MENKISIIVPVYNTENQIRYCLDSILNQTYKNLEIIVVDDGTKDNAGIIAEEYSKKDDRIIVIHQENQGLSAARNAGLSVATGDYISFVDSDDVLKIDFYEYMIDVLKKEDYPEIVQASFLRIDEDNIENVENILEENEPEEEIKTMSNIEALEKLYGADQLEYVKFVVVWNKIYKKELYGSLRFPKGRNHEDEYTTYKAIYAAKRIAYSNRLVYGYIQTKKSIMRVGISQKRIDDTLEAYRQVYSYFKENNLPEIESKAKRRYLEYCIELVEKINQGEVLAEQEKQIEFLNNEFIRFYDENISFIKENAKAEELEIIKNLEKYYEEIRR